ncbi:uncharacterized protein LOC129756290 [Uranotaenia lowii]|uniref:uncharacterized protein LOC129756290 n=1 Tax=Uranotaenia lowii TaxID=190385 RepID=UPI002479225B|nr:uncharacterized protein LOC129756290 [Uranotaenia lowii]
MDRLFRRLYAFQGISAALLSIVHAWSIGYSYGRLIFRYGWHDVGQCWDQYHDIVCFHWSFVFALAAVNILTGIAFLRGMYQHKELLFLPLILTTLVNMGFSITREILLSSGKFKHKRHPIRSFGSLYLLMLVILTAKVLGSEYKLARKRKREAKARPIGFRYCHEVY